MIGEKTYNLKNNFFALEILQKWTDNTNNICNDKHQIYSDKYDNKWKIVRWCPSHSLISAVVVAVGTVFGVLDSSKPMQDKQKILKLTK